MKRLGFTAIIVALISTFGIFSCEDKTPPAKKIAGTYTGNFSGDINGNDTIIGSGVVAQVSVISDNKVKVEGTVFSTFEVLVTDAGANVEIVSPTDGVSEFLYQGSLSELSFKYIDPNDGDVANYTGLK